MSACSGTPTRPNAKGVESRAERKMPSTLSCVQVGVDEKGKPCLGEATAAGVSYEPVGEVSGLAVDAMQHSSMRDLATVSLVRRCVVCVPVPVGYSRR